MNYKQMQNAPIRVLHVVTYMGRGGIETMIMNYYRHMDRSKVQFDFLVHRDFRADYDDEIEQLGGKIFRLPRLIPWSISYRRSLMAFFRDHPEYRIVHSHINCLSAVILKTSKKMGVSVRISHSHICNPQESWVYPIKLYYRRKLPKYANEFFACGKNAGDWLFRGETYKIINNAIDSEKYAYDPKKRQRVREEWNLSEGAFVLGHIGRFESQKNHVFLLEIFAEVKKRKKEAVLMLVGDGQLRAELEEKAKNIGLEDSVIFTGVRSDVPDLLQAMDCFVFPSLFEGLGIVLIEAQAAGLPCLISDGVPLEGVITNRVKQIALSAGVCAWAECVIDTVNVKRIDTSNDILRAGYDIKANAEKLQDFYLDHWNAGNGCAK